MAKSRKLVFFTGLLTSFTLASFPVNVSGEPPLLFTFGDSSYDVGNTKFFSSEFDPATTWPYGESADFPSGRWSDGNIVPDFIGQLIGNRGPIPPVLDPKADLSRGASFAIAGALVYADNKTMGLHQQIRKFLDMQKKWTDKERAEAIYMVNIGADDNLTFAKGHPNASLSDQFTQVSCVLTRIHTELGDYLYQSGGARKFAVQNLGPLGCLPIVKQEFKTGESCMEMLNFMVKTHNERLTRVLSTMPRLKIYRDFQYSLFDFHGQILGRIDEPSRHGYTDTTTACCGTGSRNAYGCGYSNVHSKLCSYQDSFLFFDGRHNTEKTNEDIANLFYSGDRRVVSPVNIKDLVDKPVTNFPAQEI